MRLYNETNKAILKNKAKATSFHFQAMHQIERLYIVIHQMSRHEKYLRLDKMRMSESNGKSPEMENGGDGGGTLDLI